MVKSLNYKKLSHKKLKNMLKPSADYLSAALAI